MTETSTAWKYGAWHLSLHNDDGTFRVVAVKTTKARGTRHGSYVVLPGGEVLTVSMADAAVNKHLRTAKISKTLATLIEDCPGCNAEAGEECRPGCLGTV